MEHNEEMLKARSSLLLHVKVPACIKGPVSH
jgi:hypothetical protein